MTAEKTASLIEALIDWKIQHYAESTVKTNPQLARILHEKRESDLQRLEQIRADLIRSIAETGTAAKPDFF